MGAIFSLLNSPLIHGNVLITDACDLPLGLEDGRVTKQALSASSMYNYYYGPWSGRLQARNQGSTRGGWVAKYNNQKQWLQVDLGTISRVKRIATQGRYDASQWVTSYTVSYSLDGIKFYPYKEHGKTRVRSLTKSLSTQTPYSALAKRAFSTQTELPSFTSEGDTSFMIFTME